MTFMGWGRSSEKNVFRGSSYNKNVWIGKRTVKDGECATIWHHDGTATEIQGPRLVWICFGHVRFLDRFCASQHEFLRVQHKNGTIEHLKGPIAIFCNPAKHENITVKPTILLNATDVVMLHSEQKSCKLVSGPDDDDDDDSLGDRSLETRMVKGPCVLMPLANERILTFTWYSRDDKKGGLTKSEEHKLSLVPQNLSLSVTARTADKGEITVDVCVRYKPDDMQKMMEATLDPIGGMIDAIRADVASTVKEFEYSQLAEASNLLCSLEQYQQLKSIATNMGFTLLSVGTTGYQGSEKLDGFEANAMAARAELTLTRAAAEQKRELHDLELSAAMLRLDRESSMKREALSNSLGLEALKRAHQQEMEAKEHKQRMAFVQEERQGDLAFYQALRERAGVDITSLLLAKEGKAPPASQSSSLAPA